MCRLTLWTSNSLQLPHCTLILYFQICKHCLIVLVFVLVVYEKLSLFLHNPSLLCNNTSFSYFFHTQKWCRCCCVCCSWIYKLFGCIRCNFTPLPSSPTRMRVRPAWWLSSTHALIDPDWLVSKAQYTL